MDCCKYGNRQNVFSLALNSAGMHALGATTVNFDPQGLPNSWIDGLLSSLSAMLGSALRVDYSRIAAVLFAGFLIMFSVWYLLRRKKSNSVALPLMILGWTWNNRLVPNRKRSMSRLYIVILLI